MASVLIQRFRDSYEALRDLAECAGPVVKLSYNENGPCMIMYKYAVSAQCAVRMLNNIQFNGHKLSISPSNIVF